MDVMEGTITIVQESRFQLTDDDGVTHLFMLGHDAGAEPDQIALFQVSQARVRVRYTVPRNLIGLVAHSIASA